MGGDEGAKPPDKPAEQAERAKRPACCSAAPRKCRCRRAAALHRAALRAVASRRHADRPPTSGRPCHGRAGRFLRLHRPLPCAARMNPVGSHRARALSALAASAAPGFRGDRALPVRRRHPHPGGLGSFAFYGLGSWLLLLSHRLFASWLAADFRVDEVLLPARLDLRLPVCFSRRGPLGLELRPLAAAAGQGHDQTSGGQGSAGFWPAGWCARLMGFPDRFRMGVRKDADRSFYAPVGNAVVPAVIEAMGALLLEAAGE
uniref:Uncharacterized protein n=1 Tax=Alexandrium monilatum TaxID=311494 RepID=A0A7S4V3N3_9DINO